MVCAQCWCLECFAAPAPADGDVSSISARSVAPATRFVIYSDNWVTGVLPPASALKVHLIAIDLTPNQR